ncbi:biotin/lipoyl-binding protein, partial [Pseudomonas chlororaphis]
MVDHSMQSSVSRNSRRWLLGLLVLLAIVGLCWKFWPASTAPKDAAGQKAAAGHTGRSGSMRPGFGGASGPIPVRVAPATRGDFALYYKALGTVTALNTINVRSRVAGELVKVAFEEGQMVKAGDLLAEIDPRPYQNALLQAEGTLLQNQAQLK